MPLDPSRLPRHVAIIMDGNGRWATARGLERLAGHRKGADSVRDVTRAAREIGLKALTLYAFSSQNWSRPPDEVLGLMQLLDEFVHTERAEILDHDIRLRAVGEIDRLPDFVRAPLLELCAVSAGNRGMILTLALSYGGRESLVDVTRRLCAAAAAGELRPDDVDEETIDRSLWTAGLPSLDLLIRTSGEQRLSNFLLWESAYAELWFTDVPWPDFDRSHLVAALTDYAQRERRFGKTSAQLRESPT
ncbi:MAG: di-trans,poly-cis-decaprenylcistransferase [Deltaproteobacteria bacterium]|nr:di-trans,poly-cis-decaprenylcistransferase [Deltaproteobacteria bacterium]